jgi:DNA-binding Lrp family transcriptional regulator
MDESKERSELDELDKKILNALMGDARLSLRQLAEKIGHSVSTIQKRYNRLLEEGYIDAFRAVLNTKKFEDWLTAIVGVKVEGGQLVNIEKDISSQPGVCAVYDVTGNFDAMVIVKFKSKPELNSFVKRLLSNKSVKETFTFMVLNTIKEDFKIDL